MKKLYFPVPLYTGVEILRGKRNLEDACKTPQDTVIGYTDRAVAVLERRRAFEDQEVCLVVLKMTDQTFNEILMGDFQHFGPCAHWKSPHVLEIEHGGYGRFRHEALFSLQMVKG
jgi:hypothetical protein